ncbi:prenyltransferase/squalene oxidase repeat-containing protein [Streptomyces sp. NPDC002454]
MKIRRAAAALAVTAVLGSASAPAAFADGAVRAASPSPSSSVALPAGLYGSGDPTYDGVWRQSLALLAQDAVGVTPAPSAVRWLGDQQCADGGFAAYRAQPATACDAKTPVDTNSTAAAVQALSALGRGSEAKKAVEWLRSVQNADGGWGYLPGAPSDTNSTGLVVGALLSGGTAPSGVRSKEKGATPEQALLKLALPCSAEGGGAFAYQPDKKGNLVANDDATAAGVLGGLGLTLVLAPAADRDAPGTCVKARTGADAARNGALHLAEALAADGHLSSSMPGAEDQPDHGTTADAVVALTAAGLGDRTERAVAWLERESAGWAERTGPAAWAQLVLTAHAAGADPRDFGSTDLVAQLNATGPEPASVPEAAGEDPHGAKSDDGWFSWNLLSGLLLALGLAAAGVAAQFLVLRARRRR